MSRIDEKLHSCLTGDASVAAVVNDRVYSLTLPQGTELPAIAFTLVSVEKQPDAGGLGTQERARVQVDCYAEAYKGARELSVLVSAAIDAATAFKAGAASFNDLYEEDTEIFRVSMDFSLWHEE